MMERVNSMAAEADGRLVRCCPTPEQLPNLPMRTANGVRVARAVELVKPETFGHDFQRGITADPLIPPGTGIPLECHTGITRNFQLIFRYGVDEYLRLFQLVFRMI